MVSIFVKLTNQSLFPHYIVSGKNSEATKSGFTLVSDVTSCNLNCIDKMKTKYYLRGAVLNILVAQFEHIVDVELRLCSLNRSEIGISKHIPVQIV